MIDNTRQNEKGGYPLETIDLLRQLAGRTDIIQRACQKINEGITDLCAALAPPSPPPQETQPKPRRDLSVLTRRHREILHLMTQGIPIPDIAKRLKLSPRTVDSHRDTMRRNLGLPTVAALDEFSRQLEPRPLPGHPAP